MVGLRVFQVYLSDLVQGGNVFQSSTLVPRSQIAFGFLESILSSPELIDLLRQSIKKGIVAAGECRNGDGLSDVLQLMAWLAAYSKASEAAVSTVFCEMHKDLIALAKDREENWVPLAKVTCELSLSNPSEQFIKTFSIVVVEALAESYGRDCLKALDKEGSDETTIFLNLLAICARMLPKSLTKELLGGSLLQPVLLMLQRSSNVQAFVLLQ